MAATSSWRLWMRRLHGCHIIMEALELYRTNERTNDWSQAAVSLSVTTDSSQITQSSSQDVIIYSEPFSAYKELIVDSYICATTGRFSFRVGPENTNTQTSNERQINGYWRGRNKINNRNNDNGHLLWYWTLAVSRKSVKYESII